MFKNFEDTNLGIWSAHGEGKFILPGEETDYNIVGKYSKNSFPSNPNGSDFNTAILANKDGRHIAMMPHLERSLFPWNWGFYPKNKAFTIFHLGYRLSKTPMSGSNPTRLILYQIR